MHGSHGPRGFAEGICCFAALGPSCEGSALLSISLENRQLHMFKQVQAFVNNPYVVGAGSMCYTKYGVGGS